MQLLDVVAETRPGLVRQERFEVPPQHVERKRADRPVGIDRSETEALGLRLPQVDREQARLVLAQLRGSERASDAQALDERHEGVDRCRGHLDLDAAKARRSRSVARLDPRLVERHLTGSDASGRDGKGVPVRPHLEETQELLAARDGANALSDGTVGLLKRLDVDLVEVLRHLAPVA